MKNILNQELKVVHIISSIDVAAGGPSKSVSDLALNQAKNGHHVTIFTKWSANPYILNGCQPNLVVHLVKDQSFTKALKSYLIENQCDIFHGHGIWQPPVHIMAKLARKNKIPYIISPRGMLEPWALNNGKLKKIIALKLFQSKDLRKAACILSTSEMEATQFRNLGFNNPIGLIPNAIDLAEYPFKFDRKRTNKQTILFLSRIHPKKGIEILIEAWMGLSSNIRENWSVEIAGNGDFEYINRLNQLIEEKKLNKDIKIIGPQFGDDKIKSFQRADLFVLPSFSENFGVVVIEALACGIPVITTKGTPWEELVQQGCGWWIEIGVKPLLVTLERALKKSQNELEEMGVRGRKLVEEKYTIRSTAEQSIELYQLILDKKRFSFFKSVN